MFLGIFVIMHIFIQYNLSRILDFFFPFYILLSPLASTVGISVLLFSAVRINVQRGQISSMDQCPKGDKIAKFDVNHCLTNSIDFLMSI